MCSAGEQSTMHPAIIKLFCIFSLVFLFVPFGCSPFSRSTYLMAIKKHNILKIKQKVFLLHCRRSLKGFRRRSPRVFGSAMWKILTSVAARFLRELPRSVFVYRNDVIYVNNPYAKFCLFFFGTAENKSEDAGKPR